MESVSKRKKSNMLKMTQKCYSSYVKSLQLFLVASGLCGVCVYVRVCLYMYVCMSMCIWGPAINFRHCFFGHCSPSFFAFYSFFWIYIIILFYVCKCFACMCIWFLVVCRLSLEVRRGC